MKIIREGDCVFLVEPEHGYGFNLKLISRVQVESMREYGQGCDDLFLQVWTAGGERPCSLTVSREIAEQLFQDSPWALVLRKS